MPRLATRAYHARRSRGVSLLELVVVISLIAIASGWRPAHDLGHPRQAAARALARMAAQLRFARATAIVTGQPQRFELDARRANGAARSGAAGELPKKIEVIAVGARDEQAAAGVAIYGSFPRLVHRRQHPPASRHGEKWRVDTTG